METKWLEDFITLAQTRNFSKAASLRCVTQPAFSRRIQALESWLGCELIDRGAYPTRLSSQGEVFYEQAISMLEQMRQARNIVRGSTALGAVKVIRIAVPHTLAFSKIPGWIEKLKQSLKPYAPSLSFQLSARNMHDAVLDFTNGGSDFLVCYNHMREPIELDPQKYEVKTLGHEDFLPFSKAGLDGHPLYDFTPSLANKPLPVLAFARHAYLSRMADIALESGPPFLREIIFETDMSECLKALCEKGLGVAWLPASAVQAAESTQLMELKSPYQTRMEVRLIRRISENRENQSNSELLNMAWHLWPQ